MIGDQSADGWQKSSGCVCRVSRKVTQTREEAAFLAYLWPKYLFTMRMSRTSKCGSVSGDQHGEAPLALRSRIF